MDLFERMNQRDRDEFRRTCNRLMSTCFIVREDDRTRSDYYFILRHRDVFESYLDVLGYQIEINDEYGVVQMVNRENYNHVQLTLHESMILLILRILYDEKKRALSVTDVVINTGDIQEKYLSLQIREDQLNKKTLSDALRKFRRFHLVNLLDRDILQEDARILIYDSILMAIRTDDIRQASQLLERYRKGGGQEHEDPDQSQIDQLAPVRE